ncbi:endonuclease III [Desulfonema ishimotonii]|uniref:Endonuclease III n=1 Tax=Desulfonema ishimotonii TaxID=45657 RepID=A0A401FYF9_9BACT|nr:endonuclease III [Desulfonema ishimotonii]GBC62042.1 endonuclease III [Desulfonema ishimotonii]
MKEKADVGKICRILRMTYPDVKTQLDHRDAFEMLIATILSAQCTDRQVNSVTPALFRAFPEPERLAEAALPEIEALVYATGFYRNKAGNIKNCAKALVGEFGGQVPDTLEALVRLPGVGRKTANVVLGEIFGKPTIVVDTHVRRISNRLGLTQNSDPTKIEFDLMAVIPEDEWNDFGLRLIYFGREICVARKPKCPECPLRDLCDYPEKTMK